jgi:hypothetical protein
MTNLWAIVCGQIRDEAAALKKIRVLNKLRTDGILQGVVCSAWFGDYDTYPALARAVSDAKFIFVESDLPRLKLRGHAFHQSKSIHMALQFVPDDALVLRLRPDLAELTPEFLSFLTALQLGDVRATTPAAPVYHSTVFINSGFLGCPFYINDIILLASKPDLRRIFHFDYGFEFFGSNLAPEQFFYLRAFADKFPLLDAFSRLNAGLVFDKPDISTRLMRAQLDSDLFIDVLGLYWVLLADSFDIGFLPSTRRDASRVEAQIGRCSLFDLFTTPGEILGLLRHVGANATVCARDEAVHVLLDGKLLRDRDSERLDEAIKRARQRLHGPQPWPEPDPALIDTYVTAVSSVLPLNTGLPKPVTETRFGLWGYDQPEIAGYDQTYERMAAELNVLRRTIDELRGSAITKQTSS